MTLKIRPEQFEALQAQTEDQFVRNVQQALVAKYPHCLPRFPNEIQKRIVNNMLDRAKHRGLSSQASLAAFAELMMAIAPNFDEQTTIKAAIEALPDDDRDAEFQNLAKLVPDQAWKEAETNAETLPLYLSVEQIDKPLPEKTAAALPLLLWDKQNTNVQSLAEASCTEAETLKLTESNDAPITHAVWQTLYGKDYNNPTLHPWLGDIFDRQRPSRQVVALLKLRIMLDHKRWV